MTDINPGDTLNLAGSTRVFDMTTLRNGVQHNDWQPFDPAPVGELAMTSKWRLGYADTWASGTHDWTTELLLYWGNLGQEACSYPNINAFNALGSTPFSMNGQNVLGTIRKLTAPEKATMASSNANALANSTLLGVAACTHPYGLMPPFAVSFTAKIPIWKGTWPAFWLLPTARNWPPEIDILEAYNDNGTGTILTDSIHSLTSGWTNLITPPPVYVVANNTASDITPTPAGKNLATDFISYQAVVYPDGIWIFYDNKCVRHWPMPTDGNVRWYLLLDATTRSGTDVNTVFTPLEVSDLAAYKMPATYGAGQAPPVITPPPVTTVPPVTVTTVYIGPGAGSFTDSHGNVFTIDANMNAMENGKPIPNGDGTSRMALSGDVVYGEDATNPGTWYTWDSVHSWRPSAPPPAATPVPSPTPPSPPSTDHVITDTNYQTIKTAIAAAQGALNVINTTLG